MNPQSKENLQDIQLENILRISLTSEAKERLSNIKIVNPGLYAQISQFIYQLYSSGRINQKIDDFTLKDFLGRLTPKREFKITRK